MTDKPIENPPVYNADYFIAKFEAIPEEEWRAGAFGNDNTPHCALGHCGRRMQADTREAQALCELVPLESPVLVNDGDCDRYPQPTPKQRILAWLRDAKEAGL